MKKGVAVCLLTVVLFSIVAPASGQNTNVEQSSLSDTLAAVKMATASKTDWGLVLWLMLGLTLLTSVLYLSLQGLYGRRAIR